MDDRELLTLAAKAAGLAIDSEASAETGRGLYLDDAHMTLWNPLTSDGDALRLAVKLQLLVNVTEFFVVATNGSEGAEELCEGVDPYAATRRAIVRAAAEIGRAM